MNRSLPVAVLLFALVFFLVSERIGPRWLAEENGPVVVSLWAFSTPAETMNQLKSDFENEHPEIRVEVQTIAWDDLQKKTLWAIAANSNVPDVIVGSSEWTGGLIASGGLEPLDARDGETSDWRLDREFLSRFFDTALGIYQFPEIRRDRPGWRGAVRQYGIPLDLDLMMIFYRADVIDPILAELGMASFPQTWADFERLGIAVRDKAAREGQSARLLYLDPNDPVPISMAFLPASGASFLDAQFRRAVFDSPEATEAFSFFGRLLDSGVAVRWERSIMEDPIILYKTGRTLVNIAGPWYTKYLQRKAPELAGKWRAAMFPRRAPQLPTCGLGGACLAMPYNAPHKKEASLLIRFMSTDRFALAYFNRVGSPPPVRTAWKDPVFDEGLPYFGGQKVYHVVRQAIESARPLQMLPNSEVVRGPVVAAMREISIGHADATATLRAAALRANRILSEE